MPEEAADDSDRALRLPAFEQIVLPTKASEEVSWTTELPAMIAAMGENPSTYHSAMTQFDRMRRDMACAPASPAGIDMAITYYRQLQSLGERLPLEEQAIAHEFVWHDAFDHNIAMGQTSVAFEKANVLFNIGALLSQAASSAETARNYQASASTLRYIADNFEHAPLKDIRPPAVKFLASLMLAQAQEAVVLKASLDGKGDGTIAKLAAAASSQYADACRRLESSELADLRSCLLSGVANGSDRDAYSLVLTKNALWQSISAYYAAFAAYGDKRVGEALGRLQQCNDAVKAAMEGNEFADGAVCVRFLKRLAEHAADRLPKWQKENAIIYGQIVPNKESLPKTVAAMLVKIVPLDDAWRFVSLRPDAFKGLMPLSAHTDLSLYSEEKSKLLRYETSKATAADTEMQALLTSLGFPASLERLMADIHADRMPDEISRLRERAVANLPDPSATLAQLRTTIDSTISALDDEISETQRVRLECGAECGLAPSHEGNAEIFKALASCEDKWSTLQAKVPLPGSAILPSDQTTLAILTAPESQLPLLVPGLFVDKGHSVKALATSIQALLDEIDGLAKERSAALNLLRQMILDDAPDGTTVSAAKASNFESLLAKFDEPCSRIETSAARQTELTCQFRDAWNQLCSRARADEVETARRAFTETAGKALEAKDKLSVLLDSLAKEAVSLLKDAEALQQRANAFCTKRAQERRAIAVRRGEADAASKNAYLLSKLQSLSVASGAQQQLPETKSNIESLGANGVLGPVTTTPSDQVVNSSQSKPSLLD